MLKFKLSITFHIAWYYKIVVFFFSTSNDCWSTSGWLWIAIFVLLLESLANAITAVTFVGIIIAFVGVIIAYVVKALGFSTGERVTGTQRYDP